MRDLIADEEAVFAARMNGGYSAPKFKLVDLFSGAGGLSLGFSQHFGHPFAPVWANDFNQSAVNTYNLNFGNHCVLGDISDIMASTHFTFPKADVIIGGPPCQGFSLLNKNREGDERKLLWKPFLKFVAMSGADIFVMENVPQLLGSHEFLEIAETSLAMGYTPAYHCLRASDYGVPQSRSRAFIVGCNFADPNCVFPPKKTHFDPSRPPAENLFEVERKFVQSPSPWKTVRDAILDLPTPLGTEIRAEAPPLDLHFGRTPTPLSRARYKAIPKEGQNRFDLQEVAPELTPGCWIRKTTGGTDLFGRLWWDRPAFTIRTEFFKPEKGRYLHPKEHRPITHREAARLQSFPDAFLFSGTKIEIAKQIGNAVPPVLAARVADCVVALLALRESFGDKVSHKVSQGRTDVARTNA